MSFAARQVSRTSFTLPATSLSAPSGVPIAPFLNLRARSANHGTGEHEALAGKYRSDYSTVPKWAARTEMSSSGLVVRSPYMASPTTFLNRRMLSTSSSDRKPAAAANATSPTLGSDHDAITSPNVPDYSKYTSKATEATTRALSYFVVGSMGLLTAAAAKSAVSDFIANLTASADVLALAKVEVELANIPEGKNVIIKWRGKPVFIRHRTEADIKDAESVDIKVLRDPESDKDRVKKPEWLIMVGVCTHLGCVPIGEAGDYNGWFCPCHGSHYDSSGRVRKGPAPLNLEVPEYDFPEEGKLIIG